MHSSTAAGLAATAMLGVLILAGCGSSKPAYCSDVSNFENAVKQLKDVSSPADLLPAAQKVQSTGQTALAAVKSSFAPETSAVKSSLSALGTSVKQLSSSSTRASAVAALPAEVSAVSSAAQNFADAAKKSKCS